MMIMRIIIPTPRLSLYPCESQTCPVGCEYAVSTIGVLEVISRLIEPWHYHLPLPMDFSSQSVSSICQRLLFALTLQSSTRASLLCRIAMLQKLKARYGFWCYTGRCLKHSKLAPGNIGSLGDKEKSPAISKVVPDRGGFAIYWMSLTDSTYIPYVRIVEAPIQHCDAKVMLIYDCSKYFWDKM